MPGRPTVRRPPRREVRAGPSPRAGRRSRCGAGAGQRHCAGGRRATADSHCRAAVACPVSASQPPAASRLPAVVSRLTTGDRPGDVTGRPPLARKTGPAPRYAVWGISCEIRRQGLVKGAARTQAPRLCNRDTHTYKNRASCSGRAKATNKQKKNRRGLVKEMSRKRKRDIMTRSVNTRQKKNRDKMTILGGD